MNCRFLRCTKSTFRSNPLVTLGDGGFRGVIGDAENKALRGDDEGVLRGDGDGDGPFWGVDGTDVDIDGDGGVLISTTNSQNDRRTKLLLR